MRLWSLGQLHRMGFGRGLVGECEMARELNGKRLLHFDRVLMLDKWRCANMGWEYLEYRSERKKNRRLLIIISEKCFEVVVMSAKCKCEARLL